MQGQDPRGVRLAIRSRTAGLSAADVDLALSQQRTLVITWLNRGTLHLVRSEAPSREDAAALSADAEDVVRFLAAAV